MNQMMNKTPQVYGVLEFMQTSDPGLSQGYTNPTHQVAVPTEFYAVAPNICRSSVCALFRATIPAPRILR